MSNKLKSTQDFYSHLTSLFHELRDANDHFYFVNCLVQAISDYEREINCAPTFWTYTINAHTSATMSHLCRVYDYEPAAVHLLFLLETVRDNPDIFCKQALKQRLGQRAGCDDLVEHFGDPDMAQIEADMKFCRHHDPDPLIEKLRNWRHNLVAHLNKRVSIDFDSFKKRWPLEQKDIQELISKGHDILERCAGWYGAASLSLNLPSDKDYKFVLESVRLNLSRRDEQDDLLLKLISKRDAQRGQTPPDPPETPHP
jgi:hypothetical protein